MQAWTSRKAREVVSLGRELLGGNGILADFLVAKVRGTQHLLRFHLLIFSRHVEIVRKFKITSKLFYYLLVCDRLIALCKQCDSNFNLS